MANSCCAVRSAPFRRCRHQLRPTVVQSRRQDDRVCGELGRRVLAAGALSIQIDGEQSGDEGEESSVARRSHPRGPLRRGFVANDHPDSEMGQQQ